MYSIGKRTVADNLKPTFENVTREFITNNLYNILFSDKLPNFRFEFRENEAIQFIERVLKDKEERNGFHTEDSKMLLQQIRENQNTDDEKPVMVVNNYKEFFELLRQFYEESIELYFIKTNMTNFPIEEKDNCFELIWLRATPDDFKNPENFLRKQVEMIKDNTFAKYDEETCIGKIQSLNNNILCVKNEIAKNWDENSREFIMRIYDKNFYNRINLHCRPHYSLPVVRYGIYERDGKRVCQIGSIQNKNYDENKTSSLAKDVANTKKQLNEEAGKKESYKDKIEASKIIALSIFVNFLMEEGITDIEVPGMYVLDYEYHRKRGIQIKEDFERKWIKEKVKEYPDLYEDIKNCVLRNSGKEDLISEIKTERLIYTFRRLLYHYKEGSVNSYPGELDCLFHLRIPIAQGKDEIRGEFLQELYGLVKETYLCNER